MAKSEYFTVKRLSLAQQRQRMQALYPNFKMMGLGRSRAIWEGAVKPSSLSETYKIRVIYKFYDAPCILVLSPKLQKVEGSKAIKHTYPGEELCLYYPPAREWHSGKFIADNIIPWISLWLYFYEVWHATDEWLGGGIEHVGRKSNV